MKETKETTTFIPVSSPDIGDLEMEYVTEAVTSGWVSSIGEFIDRFEKGFASYCGASHGVSMSNGTDSLFIALKTLGVEPGDEVIVPSLTFVAVPAVVVHLGAKPVIVDSHPDYWCMDPEAVEKAISPRTKAIVVVHVYGHPADMDPILELARMNGIKVIEDCAEAHGAKYKGRTVGSIGDVGCFSFYGNKIITTGEGGMAVTSDPELAARMRFLKDHAMDPNRRYFHPEAGFNCRMTNVQAAIGCAQLERIDELIGRRAQILEWYREKLKMIGSLTINPRMSWADPVNWMVCVSLEKRLKDRRDVVLLQLDEQGVDNRPFFVPVEKMPPYSSCRVVGVSRESTPISEMISSTSFNLPTNPRLKNSDIDYIVRLFEKIIVKCNE